MSVSFNGYFNRKDHVSFLTRRNSSRGFTLFEISISLALVAFGVVSVMMLYPVGIKTQLMARYQILASAKAEEMVQLFNASGNQSHSDEHEGLGPWDVPLAYRAHSFDLETRLQTSPYGLMPLPPDIARRLESDNNEIQNLLNQGGRIYYSQPNATAGFGDRGISADEPNEAQKLIVGVIGYAQHNDMPLFPWKAWPYYVAYPSPPLFGSRFHNAWKGNTAFNTGIPDPFLPTNARTFTIKPLASNNSKPGEFYCWEGTSPFVTEIPGADPDVMKVFDGYWRYSFGTDYNAGPSTDNWTEQGAIEYLQVALWYAQKKGFDSSFYNPSPVPTNPGDFVPNTLDSKGEDFKHDAWKQVLAIRFLSHAATCMTRWKTLSELGGQPSGAGTGVDIPANSNGSPAIKLTHDLIVYYHQRCMNLVMRYAASFPYDWGAPRPANRYQMMDAPLIEWDMFQPPLQGKIFDVSPTQSKIEAAQWKPLPARPIYNVGVSYQYPVPTLPYKDLYSGSATQTIPDGKDFGSTAYKNFWGDPNHRTLTKPFTPAQRCRQIVFWAVDWQSYVDCETAPSAPVDASKYPIISSFSGMDFNNRVQRYVWSNDHMLMYRNPEKLMMFREDISALPNGADVTQKVAGWVLGNTWSSQYDKMVTQLNARKIFSGLYGADRNFNRQLDRGNLPVSVRLKAATVARFNYYDPRLTLSIR